MYKAILIVLFIFITSCSKYLSTQSELINDSSTFGWEFVEYSTSMNCAIYYDEDLEWDIYAYFDGSEVYKILYVMNHQSADEYRSFLYERCDSYGMDVFRNGKVIIYFQYFEDDIAIVTMIKE